MDIEITASSLRGDVIAPSSKSLSHRAIIVAALAHGTSTLTNILQADDIKQTIEGLRKLGVSITENGSSLVIRRSKLRAAEKPIHLGQSGSSLRFLTAVAGLAQGTTVLTGEKRLCARPMADMIEPLKAMGIEIRSLRNNGCAPIEVIGGRVVGGSITVRANVSSQFASALLLIAPLANTKTTLHVVDAHSEPYIGLTRSVMQDFGVDVKVIKDDFIIAPLQQYQGRVYAIEGDYSSSSYVFAAAAVTGSTITVQNLNPRSLQGDRYFLALLKRMGCTVMSDEVGITLIPPRKLNAIRADLGDFPDIVQSLSVVAAVATGTTKITNIGHLKHKETDRLLATSMELRTMGIDATSDNNSIMITGGTPKGAEIDTHNDHRMAMSFAVLGLGSTGTTVIRNAQVVNKSYPSFFRDMVSLGAHIKESL